MPNDIQLQSWIAADGSRQFAEVPWREPQEIKRRISSTQGFKLTEFLDSITETWIDFDYAGHSFTAHNPLNDFCLFVSDPKCPDNVLCEVIALFIRGKN